MTDHCCAHPKCPGGSLCCCQGQPDPIERAAEALVNAAFGQELPEAPIDLAKAVLDSIDTDELIATILRTELPEGLKVGHADKIALAVKNWLTGKDQQQ